MSGMPAMAAAGATEPTAQVGTLCKKHHKGISESPAVLKPIPVGLAGPEDTSSVSQVVPPITCGPTKKKRGQPRVTKAKPQVQETRGDPAEQLGSAGPTTLDQITSMVTKSKVTQKNHTYDTNSPEEFNLDMTSEHGNSSAGDIGSEEIAVSINTEDHPRFMDELINGESLILPTQMLGSCTYRSNSRV